MQVWSGIGGGVMALMRRIGPRFAPRWEAGRAERWLLAAVALSGAAAFAAYALWVGQDANWDLQNYHRYAAYSLLHWRYFLDVVPAGIQTFLNPLPYLPPYVLGVLLPAKLAAVVLAAAQSAVVPLAWLVAGAVQRRRDLAVRLCATVAAVASAATISEIGTSFADLLLAIPVLGAVLALVRPGAGAARWRRVAVAGGLLGMATGLKLTNVVFFPGLVLAALAVPGGWRARGAGARVVGALAAVGGFGAGGALTGGAWVIYLWRSLGNPVFPGLNSVFRSSSAAFWNFNDTHFLPAGWRDALAYPFRIALGSSPTSENPFAEPRFAVALVVGVPVLLVLWRRGLLGGALVRAWLFLVAGFVAWMMLFSVERYAVALEMLAGLLVVVTVAEALPAGSGRAVALAGAALLMAGTRAPEWWHRPWSDAYVPHIPAALSEPAAYVVVTYPNANWVAALPAGSRFYGVVDESLATGGVLRERLMAGLTNPPVGGLWTLGPDLPMSPGIRARLAGFGLVPGKPCVRAASLWWVDTVFCRLTREGGRRFAAADLAPGEMVRFDKGGSGWIYEITGWGATGRDGTAISGLGRLAFRPTETRRPLLLSLSAQPESVPASLSGEPFLIRGSGGEVLPVARGDRSINTTSVCILGTPPDAVVDLSVSVNNSSGKMDLMPSVASIEISIPDARQCGG